MNGTALPPPGVLPEQPSEVVPFYTSPPATIEVKFWNSQMNCFHFKVPLPLENDRNATKFSIPSHLTGGYSA